jgi:hypothetical protein
LEEKVYLSEVCEKEEADDGKTTATQKLWKGFILLLKSPAAMSVVLVALSNNWTQIAFDVYAPIYYAEHHHIDPRDSGKLMSGIRSIGLVMPFFAVIIEERIVASGVSPIRMRQLGSGGALAIVSVACVVFGWTDSFYVAAGARCAFFDRNLHSSMPLDPTPARLKQIRVRPMAFLSGVHSSYRFTLYTGSKH